MMDSNANPPFPSTVAPTLAGFPVGRAHDLGLSGVSPGESVAAILTILFFSGVSLAIFGAEQGDRAETTEHIWVYFIAQWLVILLSLPYVARYRDTLVVFAKKQKMICLLVLFASVSTLWSQFPLNTAKNSVMLCFCTVWGVYFGLRFSVQDQLRLLARALGASIVLSYLIAILAPDYGIMTSEFQGSWQGIYPHRNVLARIMILAILVFALRSHSKETSRVFCWTAIATAIILVLLSQSKTGLVILFLFGILQMLSPVLRWSRRWFVVSIVSLGALTGSLLFLLPWLDILRLLGRNITLTGRLPLWIMVAMKAIRRPWLGYGYTGFWSGYRGESASIWKILAWHPPNAHNGFLDLWVTLGLVGLAIFLAGFALVFWRSLEKARCGNSVESRWPLLYLIFLFVYNLDETNLLQHNSLMWGLYVAVAAWLIPNLWIRGGTSPSGSLFAEEEGSGV